jgi:hypothetical protein
MVREQIGSRSISELTPDELRHALVALHEEYQSLAALFDRFYKGERPPAPDVTTK